MYLEKIVTSILDKHAKKFIPSSAECKYQLDFRTKDKEKRLGVATIYIIQLKLKTIMRLKNLKKIDLKSLKMIS